MNVFAIVRSSTACYSTCFRMVVWQWARVEFLIFLYILKSVINSLNSSVLCVFTTSPYDFRSLCSVGTLAISSATSSVGRLSF